MCGGGTGSANDSSNDNDSGSGNSFKETLANIFTPNDGMSYVDGQLRESATGNRVSIPAPSNDNNGSSPASTAAPAPAPSMAQSRVGAGIMGALTGGLPGMIGSLAVNELSGGKTGGGVVDVANKAKSGLGGLFAKPEFANQAEEDAYREQQRARQQAMMAQSNDNDGGSNRAAATVTTPTVGGPATSDMTEQAGYGAFQAIPNPNYDPTDPLSPRFLSNPTYEQLLAYRSGQMQIQPGIFDPVPQPQPFFPEPTSPVDFLSNFTPVPGMPAPGSQVQGMAMGGMLGPQQNMARIPNPNQMPAFQPASSLQSLSLLQKASPLQQYGGYLEQEYGKPGFEQKKDQFLQEVQQKEQQTFGGGSPLADLNRGPDSFNRIQPFRTGNMLLQGYAEGGEIMAGNEKTAISDAVSAVKGELSEEQSALVLGQFLANYGEEALRDLVEKVQSGELDDTVERFANGEAGEVNGPGDGSGVDDKVPASLEGQQDVLLADGEFVLRKKTADALEKKYGGGFLDAVNEAENDAPRTMQQYMARN